jgi:putative salt-induced outer membrane protein YdiY
VVGCLLAAARLDATAPASGDSVRVLADIGFVSVSGNSDLTTLSFGQQLVIGTPAWLVTQDLLIVYSRSDGVTSANQLQTNGRAEHHLGDRLGVYATLHYERNPLAGIALRMQEGAGVTWAIVAAKPNQLDLAVGATLVQQRGSVDTTAGFPAAQAVATFKHPFTDRAFFQQRLEWIPNFRDATDYRVNSESTVTAPFSRRLALKVSFVIRYDNLPEPGFDSTDRVFTSGLQLSL